MCGLAVLAGPCIDKCHMDSMLKAIRHRGPDASGQMILDGGGVILGHNRLSIIDLSSRSNQPMTDPTGRFTIVLNGEIYNYLELRKELAVRYEFTTYSDTEVLLAAWTAWGQDCLDKLMGMFSFVIWDSRERELFAARDRFGVKPLYYSSKGHHLAVASEIKALHSIGLCLEPDEKTWATYLSLGYYDHGPTTFWSGCTSLEPGCWLGWKDHNLTTGRWFDLPSLVIGPIDTDDHEAEERYLDLLLDSIRLRFRSDVPVGINLSGGLDSSVLLGLVDRVKGRDSDICCYTFSTGDSTYDETPWAEKMLEHTKHRHIECRLSVEEVPKLFSSVQEYEDEPFGGLPTLAYAKLFSIAKENGTRVLLDGQGLDEQWAGYDYYPDPRSSDINASSAGSRIQGFVGSHVRPECLVSEFKALAVPHVFNKFDDNLLNSQLQDIVATKIPRTMRFSDRISMRSSTELREPFLDYRLVLNALSLPSEMKIRGGVRKYLLRRIALNLLPSAIVTAPKRPVQTPQREWLGGPLANWATDLIHASLRGAGGYWFMPSEVDAAWSKFLGGLAESSFHVWQWISVAAVLDLSTKRAGSAVRVKDWGK